MKTCSDRYICHTSPCPLLYDASSYMTDNAVAQYLQLRGSFSAAAQTRLDCIRHRSCKGHHEACTTQVWARGALKITSTAREMTDDVEVCREVGEKGHN